MTADTESLPWGYRWRSSESFIVTTATISLFSECFLFGFVVPILPYMLEIRLHLDPSQTQTFTTTLLTGYGVISLVSAPFIAHFADKTPSRKIPLLLSLAACTSGTILVACAPTVWVLMVGQTLQSLASSAVWIVAFATLVDNVDGENKGKVTGTSMSIVGTGIFAGPMVSGILLQLFGYWPAWSAALLLLAVDFIARLVMIDNRATATPDSTPDSHSTEPEERTALLADQPGDTSTTADGQKPAPNADAESPRGFYSIMLRDPQIVASIMNTLIMATILASFDTTLPLHAREVFGWGSLPAGLLFLGLNLPSIILGAPIGWMRDHFGIRWLTTIGWAMTTPLLWLMAVPGESLPWGRLERGGQAVYIVAIIGLGFGFALTRGAGSFQMMAIVQDLESKNPAIFGPYGGNSRLSSLTEVPFNVGMVIGPLLSGSFSELIGYYYMNCILAVASLLITISSWIYLTAAPVREGDGEETA